MNHTLCSINFHCSQSIVLDLLLSSDCHQTFEEVPMWCPCFFRGSKLWNFPKWLIQHPDYHVTIVAMATIGLCLCDHVCGELNRIRLRPPDHRICYCSVSMFISVKHSIRMWQFWRSDFDSLAGELWQSRRVDRCFWNVSPGFPSK